MDFFEYFSKIDILKFLINILVEMQFEKMKMLQVFVTFDRILYRYGVTRRTEASSAFGEVIRMLGNIALLFGEIV